MQLFYNQVTETAISGSVLELSHEESLHCIKVLRKKPGDIINIIDGIGNLMQANVLDTNHKACAVQITTITPNFGKRNFYTHIAIAPPKNTERLEWFLEKATEIGIHEITPLITQHSERTHLKPERLEKILVSAAKQSLTAFVPKLNPLTKISDFFKQNHPEGKFIAHCNPLKTDHLKNVCVVNSNNLVLIGPEGDFTIDEVQAAELANFTAVTLGNSRLRTETAGIVACQIISQAND